MATPGTRSAERGAPERFLQLYRALIARRRPAHGFWVLVTSARGAEGVSTVASGLARMIATEEDAVFWRIAPGPSDPDLGTIGLPCEPARPPDAVPPPGDGPRGRLYVLPDGPAALADAQGLRRLRERFRFGVIDAAPVLASPACLALAGAVDGAVVVMEAAATSWRATQDAVDVLQSSGIAPLGLVLNKVRPDLPRRWSRRLGEPVASGEAG